MGDEFDQGEQVDYLIKKDNNAYDMNSNRIPNSEKLVYKINNDKINVGNVNTTVLSRDILISDIPLLNPFIRNTEYDASDRPYLNFGSLLVNENNELFVIQQDDNVDIDINITIGGNTYTAIDNFDINNIVDYGVRVTRGSNTHDIIFKYTYLTHDDFKDYGSEFVDFMHNFGIELKNRMIGGAFIHKDAPIIKVIYAKTYYIDGTALPSDGGAKSPAFYTSLLKNIIPHNYGSLGTTTQDQFTYAFFNVTTNHYKSYDNERDCLSIQDIDLKNDGGSIYEGTTGCVLSHEYESMNNSQNWMNLNKGVLRTYESDSEYASNGSKRRWLANFGENSTENTVVFDFNAEQLTSTSSNKPVHTRKTPYITAFVYAGEKGLDNLQVSGGGGGGATNSDTITTNELTVGETTLNNNVLTVGDATSTVLESGKLTIGSSYFEEGKFYVDSNTYLQDAKLKINDTTELGHQKLTVGDTILEENKLTINTSTELESGKLTVGISTLEENILTIDNDTKLESGKLIVGGSTLEENILTIDNDTKLESKKLTTGGSTLEENILTIDNDTKLESGKLIVGGSTLEENILTIDNDTKLESGKLTTGGSTLEENILTIDNDTKLESGKLTVGEIDLGNGVVLKQQSNELYVGDSPVASGGGATNSDDITTNTLTVGDIKLNKNQHHIDLLEFINDTSNPWQAGKATINSIDKTNELVDIDLTNTYRVLCFNLDAAYVLPGRYKLTVETSKQTSIYIDEKCNLNTTSQWPSHNTQHIQNIDVLYNKRLFLFIRDNSNDEPGQLSWSDITECKLTYTDAINIGDTIINDSHIISNSVKLNGTQIHSFTNYDEPGYHPLIKKDNSLVDRDQEHMSAYYIDITSNNDTSTHSDNFTVIIYYGTNNTPTDDRIIVKKTLTHKNPNRVYFEIVDVDIDNEDRHISLQFVYDPDASYYGDSSNIIVVDSQFEIVELYRCGVVNTSSIILPKNETHESSDGIMLTCENIILTDTTGDNPLETIIAPGDILTSNLITDTLVVEMSPLEITANGNLTTSGDISSNALTVGVDDDGRSLIKLNKNQHEIDLLEFINDTSNPWKARKENSNIDESDELEAIDLSLTYRLLCFNLDAAYVYPGRYKLTVETSIDTHIYIADKCNLNTSSQWQSSDTEHIQNINVLYNKRRFLFIRDESTSDPGLLSWSHITECKLTYTDAINIGDTIINDSHIISNTIKLNGSRIFGFTNYDEPGWRALIKKDEKFYDRDQEHMSAYYIDITSNNDTSTHSDNFTVIIYYGTNNTPTDDTIIVKKTLTHKNPNRVYFEIVDIEIEDKHLALQFVTDPDASKYGDSSNIIVIDDQFELVELYRCGVVNTSSIILPKNETHESSDGIMLTCENIILTDTTGDNPLETIIAPGEITSDNLIANNLTTDDLTTNDINIQSNRLTINNIISNDIITDKFNVGTTNIEENEIQLGSTVVLSNNEIKVKDPTTALQINNYSTNTYTVDLVNDYLTSWEYIDGAYNSNTNIYTRVTNRHELYPLLRIKLSDISELINENADLVNLNTFTDSGSNYNITLSMRNKHTNYWIVYTDADIDTNNISSAGNTNSVSNENNIKVFYLNAQTDHYIYIRNASGNTEGTDGNGYNDIERKGTRNDLLSLDMFEITLTFEINNQVNLSFTNGQSQILNNTMRTSLLDCSKVSSSNVSCDTMQTSELELTSNDGQIIKVNNSGLLINENENTQLLPLNLLELDSKYKCWGLYTGNNDGDNGSSGFHPSFANNADARFIMFDPTIILTLINKNTNHEYEIYIEMTNKFRWSYETNYTHSSAGDGKWSDGDYSYVIPINFANEGQVHKMLFIKLKDNDQELSFNKLTKVLCYYKGTALTTNSLHISDGYNKNIQIAKNKLITKDLKLLNDRGYNYITLINTDDYFRYEINPFAIPLNQDISYTIKLSSSESFAVKYNESGGNDAYVEYSDIPTITKTLDGSDNISYIHELACNNLNDDSSINNTLRINLLDYIHSINDIYNTVQEYTIGIENKDTSNAKGSFSVLLTDNINGEEEDVNFSTFNQDQFFIHDIKYDTNNNYNYVNTIDTINNFADIIHVDIKTLKDNLDPMITDSQRYIKIKHNNSNEFIISHKEDYLYNNYFTPNYDDYYLEYTSSIYSNNGSNKHEIHIQGMLDHYNISNILNETSIKFKFNLAHGGNYTDIALIHKRNDIIKKIIIKRNQEYCISEFDIRKFNYTLDSDNTYTYTYNSSGTSNSDPIESVTVDRFHTSGNSGKGFNSHWDIQITLKSGIDKDDYRLWYHSTHDYTDIRDDTGIILPSCEANLINETINLKCYIKGSNDSIKTDNPLERTSLQCLGLAHKDTIDKAFYYSPQDHSHGLEGIDTMEFGYIGKTLNQNIIHGDDNDSNIGSLPTSILSDFIEITNRTSIQPLTGVELADSNDYIKIDITQYTHDNLYIKHVNGYKYDNTNNIEESDLDLLELHTIPENRNNIGFIDADNFEVISGKQYLFLRKNLIGENANSHLHNNGISTGDIDNDTDFEINLTMQINDDSKAKVFREIIDPVNNEYNFYSNIQINHDIPTHKIFIKKFKESDANNDEFYLDNITCELSYVDFGITLGNDNSVSILNNEINVGGTNGVNILNDTIRSSDDIIHEIDLTSYFIPGTKTPWARIQHENNTLSGDSYTEPYTFNINDSSLLKDINDDNHTTVLLCFDLTSIEWPSNINLNMERTIQLECTNEVRVFINNTLNCHLKNSIFSDSKHTHNINITSATSYLFICRPTSSVNYHGTQKDHWSFIKMKHLTKCSIECYKTIETVISPGKITLLEEVSNIPINLLDYILPRRYREVILPHHWIKTDAGNTNNDIMINADQNSSTEHQNTIFVSDTEINYITASIAIPPNYHLSHIHFSYEDDTSIMHSTQCYIYVWAIDNNGTHGGSSDRIIKDEIFNDDNNNLTTEYDFYVNESKTYDNKTINIEDTMNDLHVDSPGALLFTLKFKAINSNDPPKFRGYVEWTRNPTINFEP